MLQRRRIWRRIVELLASRAAGADQSGSWGRGVGGSGAQTRAPASWAPALAGWQRMGAAVAGGVVMQGQCRGGRVREQALSSVRR